MTEMPNTPTSQSHNNNGHVTAPLPIGGRTAGTSGAKRGASSHAAHNAPNHAKEPAQRHNDERPRSHKGVAALGVLCCLLVALYGGGVFVFSRTCYPNTKVAGADLSWLDRDSSVARVRDAAEDYVLEVSGDGFTWTYEAENANEVIDAARAVDNVMAHNEPALWPARLTRALMASPETPANATSANAQSSKLPELDKSELPKTFDRDAFLASLDAAIDEFNATRVGTFDAAGAFDPEAGSFTLSNELPKTFDRDAFLASLDAAIDEFNATRVGTFDAAGAFDPEAGSFTLSKALSNRKLDKDAIDRAALVAVSTLAARVELTEHSFTPLAGGATEQELQNAIDRANELIGTNVNLKMGGSVVSTLDGAQLAQWITFDEALNPTLSTEPVGQWVRELAKTHIDTVGSERTYTRPDGKTVTVSGGTYGGMSDEARLVQVLQDAVSNKQDGDIEIPLKRSAATRSGMGKPDWGAYCDIDLTEQHARYSDAAGNLVWERGWITGTPNTGNEIPLKRSAATWSGMGKPDWGAYCDIDLTEQHARYYDAAGNLVWESGCITGNPNTGNATPTGVFSLNAKTRNSTLIGLDEDEDGEPDYKTPVAYWMPFMGNAIGMHDATWQSAASFSNPKAYTWTGSHGCVNLPPDRAAALFDIISKGFAVCAAVKETSPSTPVIFLTASDDEFNTVTGLTMGADDYGAKPFRPRELLARIAATIRRSQPSRRLVSLGDIRIDTDRAYVERKGVELTLSALEYRLLLLFATNPRCAPP